MIGRRPVALLALTLAVPASPGTAAPDPIEVYVLAGQSNMSGRGDLAGLSASERVADPGIRLFGNDGHWRSALDPLDDAAGQLDAVSTDRQAAVGPGLFFARALSRLGAPVIALVPCAKGGAHRSRGGSRGATGRRCSAHASRE